MKQLIYLATITQARYGGAYEPGEWLAWPLPADSLPPNWDAGDNDCLEFWQTYQETVGAGATPDAALADLEAAIAASRSEIKERT